ncbi:MAG TPA: hypothetical protein VK524_34155, partial [Polyangiaceae bacterium]|nr:hypothetical protein [Polyangiaceae bacterium]
MIALASSCAIALYLLPVALVLAWQRARGRPAAALAFYVPAALAADLLGILALCLFLRVEQAAVVSRVLWITAAPLSWWRAKQARAASTERVTLWVPLAAAVAAALLSGWYSHFYSIWDRGWHIGLVTSLRGQRIPFQNVYHYEGYLRYHFSGDVIAATLQSLSLNVINSDFALSLAHDVMFALTGFSLALLTGGALPGERARLHPALRVLATLLGVMALLLSGPVTLMRDGLESTLAGHSVMSYFTMSFRPHVSLSGLLFVGVGACLLSRLRASSSLDTPSEEPNALPALLLIVAALGIADETSTGLMGLTLGVTWLIWPRILDERRWVGALVLLGLALAFLGTNYLFGASISPGMPVSRARWVEWRAPGYTLLPEALRTGAGLKALLFDLMPVPLTLVGLMLMRHRIPARVRGALIGFLVV